MSEFQAGSGTTAVTLVLTTEADAGRAERLARELLEAGLAACVSLRPLRSLYRWQGAIETSEEVEVLIKTGPERLAALRRRLLELHSYTTPEWIHWSAVSDGAYGLWLQRSLSPDAPPPAAGANPGDAAPAG
jgi:periplasmic divalent cation tolerance protein